MNATRFLSTLLLLAPFAGAADPACQPVIDADLKLYTMPVHIYMTKTAGYNGGAPTSSENIYVNNTTYLMVQGKWRKSPVTVQKMLDVRKEALASNTMTSCQRVREESVNGEAAVVYSGVTVSPDDRVESTTWISKARGVPLKTEMDTNVGGGKAGKSHTAVRYEYTNVKPPAGVP